MVRSFMGFQPNLPPGTAGKLQNESLAPIESARDACPSMEAKPSMEMREGLRTSKHASYHGRRMNVARLTDISSDATMACLA